MSWKKEQKEKKYIYLLVFKSILNPFDLIILFQILMFDCLFSISLYDSLFMTPLFALQDLFQEKTSFFIGSFLYCSWHSLCKGRKVSIHKCMILCSNCDFFFLSNMKWFYLSPSNLCFCEMCYSYFLY